MEIPQKRKRIFGGVLLLLMASLALLTAVLAADGRWIESDSYSLVIQKQFATVVKMPELGSDGQPVIGPDGQPVMKEVEIPEEVLDAAKEQTYRFRVKGYYLEGTGDDKVQVEIDDIVEIGPNSPDWELDGSKEGVLCWKTSGKLGAPGPIHVTVTEITNDVTLKVDGIDYNMGDSRVEMSTLFTESPQIRNLNSNGKISISRPSTKLVPAGDGTFDEVEVTTESAFRIRSEWVDEGAVKPGNWKAFDETVTLVPGAPAIQRTGLSAGQYTIEDLSVSGYNIQLGERREEVQAGETGTFYINSKPGRLVITAGGTAGDGGKHYYTVERVNAPGDAEPFEKRTTEAVESGKTYTLENLPRGEYEVTEYRVTDVPTKFTVNVAETKSVDKEQRFTNFTPKSESTVSRYYINLGGDYVSEFRYGPVYNKNGKILPQTEVYTA